MTFDTASSLPLHHCYGPILSVRSAPQLHIYPLLVALKHQEPSSTLKIHPSLGLQMEHLFLSVDTLRRNARSTTREALLATSWRELHFSSTMTLSTYRFGCVVVFSPVGTSTT